MTKSARVTNICEIDRNISYASYSIQYDPLHSSGIRLAFYSRSIPSKGASFHPSSPSGKSVCMYIYIAEDCAILRKNDDFSQVVFSEFPDARSLLDVLGSRTFLPATLTETTAAVVQGVRGIGFGLAKRLPVGEESHRLRLAVCM